VLCSCVVDPSVARKTWRTLEPYHGLVYFVPEAAAAYAELGIEGFDGYFASRGAAFGEASAELVIATFFNFHPGIVRHALPKVWSIASPTDVQAARRRAMDAALERLTAGALGGAALDRAVALVRPAAQAVADTLAGRPLAAAHLALAWPDEPRVALWHGITVLREHRGDGHVACLTEAGLDGLEALILHAATGDVPASILQASRRWNDDEWAAGVDRLASRGLVDGDGAFTDAGRTLRDGIEARTDELASPPWAAIGEAACDELRSLVRPASKAIVSGGGLVPS
jgi:hypothetical protein